MNIDAMVATMCPTCGEIELHAEQLWLVLVEPTGLAHVDFRCPSCAEEIRYSVEGETLAVLLELVPVEELRLPAEMFERPSGPPLTTDDLIDLMLALETIPEHTDDPACCR
jgi:predicted RNA-binding Zn-ribbon protein involved in translation (DUF1610 family)